MRILDVHLHVGLSGDGGEASEADLQALMREHNIERGVVFPIDDGAGVQDYAELNARVVRMQEQNPSIIGFCRVKPQEGQSAVELFHSAVDDGLQGLKLHPNSDGFHPEQAILILEAVAERGVPVILHTGHQEVCRPKNWAPIFKRFSDVRFLVTHGGKDDYRELGALMAALPNVYYETSCLSYFRSSYLYKRVGAERLLYGSDYPYSHPGIEQRKLELIIRDATVLQNVYYTNALRFLGGES